MVLQRWEFNGSRYLKSFLLFCPGKNSSGYKNIFHWYFYHLSACSVTVPHAFYRDNIFWQQNHHPGSWICFSPAIETKKQIQEPAFQPLPFLEIKMLSQLLHIHVLLPPGKICIKNRMKFAIFFELLQGCKTEFSQTTGFSHLCSCICFHLVWPKLISAPHSIIGFEAPKPRWESVSFALSCSSLPPCPSCMERLWLSKPSSTNSSQLHGKSIIICLLQFLEFLLATDSLFVLVSSLHYSSLMQHRLPRIWHKNNLSCKRSFLGPANPTEDFNSTQKLQE